MVLLCPSHVWGQMVAHLWFLALDFVAAAVYGLLWARPVKCVVHGKP